MKATASILSGWMAVVVCFSASRAVAGPVDGGMVALVGAARLTQTDGTYSPPDNKRQHAAELLQRARQAIEKNDLAAADLLIGQAESLQVEYSPITMEDTPRKARQALEQIRNAQGADAGRSGQAGSSPEPSRTATVPADPFYGRTTGAANPNLATPESDIPLAGDHPHLPPASVVQNPTPAAALRTQSDNLLRLSRRALAVGDVRRAVDLLNQAKRLQVRYGPLDDSPERTEGAISKYQDVMTLDRNTEAGRRAYARVLMDQAEALLHYGEFDWAENLADRAAQQQVTYGPFEVKPQSLLTQIAAARRQSDPMIRPVSPPSDARQARATDYPPGLAIVGESSPAPPTRAVPPEGVVSPIVYNSGQDSTYNVQAANLQPSGPALNQQADYGEPVPAPPGQAAPPPPSATPLSPPPPPSATSPAPAPRPPRRAPRPSRRATP